MTDDRAKAPHSVLLVHRYFWPDTPPYAAMLRSIAERLVKDGFRVSVFTSQPSYGDDISVQPRREQLDGAFVVRCRLLRESKSNWLARIANLFAFSTQVAWHILRVRYDLVMAATTPPILVARAASFAARSRGSHFIYHCQDIHPEISESAHLLSLRPLISLLRWLDRMTCRSASAIVVLSQDMATEIRTSRNVPHEKILIINNFEVPKYHSSDPIPSILEKPIDVFRVLFAGNIGYFQGLHTVIAAAHRLRDELHIQFVFMGRGAGVSQLKAQAGDLLGRTVLLVDHQPQAVAERALAKTDLGLISINTGVYRFAYPSKTMTYLKAGCPLLVVVESESELAQLVRQRKLGICCPPGDDSRLADAIRSASNVGPADGVRRQSIMQVGAELFSRERSLERWSDLFGAIGGSQSERPSRDTNHICDVSQSNGSK